MSRDCALLVEVFSPEIHQPILETLGGSPHTKAGLRHSKATEPGVVRRRASNLNASW